MQMMMTKLPDESDFNEIEIIGTLSDANNDGHDFLDGPGTNSDDGGSVNGCEAEN